MSQLKSIKVLVAHCDPLARAGLSATFCRYSDFEVIEALDPCGRGQPAPHAPASPLPDVVVADYERGMALVADAESQETPMASSKVMIVNGSDRECEIRRALERGVRGYLLPGCELDELANSVRAVYRGERQVSPQVAQRLAESVCGDQLTARESEVLRLVVEGLGNKSIARRLTIAVGTVKSHLKAIFDKLSVESRTQAIAVAERRGLLMDC